MCGITSIASFCDAEYVYMCIYISALIFILYLFLESFWHTRASTLRRYLARVRCRQHVTRACSFNLTISTRYQITKHHFIWLQQLYPFFLLFFHEKVSTLCTPFKWWFVQAHIHIRILNTIHAHSSTHSHTNMMKGQRGSRDISPKFHCCIIFKLMVFVQVLPVMFRFLYAGNITIKV